MATKQPKRDIGVDLLRFLASQNGYNTPLQPNQEDAFNRWLLWNANGGDLIYNDPGMRNSDYDFRGAYLDNAKSSMNAMDGKPHFTDKFKKPNHATFSRESQYAEYKPDMAGTPFQTLDGQWAFLPTGNQRLIRGIQGGWY